MKILELIIGQENPLRIGIMDDVKIDLSKSPISRVTGIREIIWDSTIEPTPRFDILIKSRLYS